MCGIAGIVGKGWEPAQLRQMAHAQRHRGPDYSAIYIDTHGDAGLAHNRLSIIDLSPAGHQPMCSADGRLWITFNGEIYNYVELRAELRDYPWRSASDTEVILAAYEKWGKACLDRFRGMFAFALWDEGARTLFCARDRFGVKPFYYHQGADEQLIFASEIKALKAGGVSASPDPATWADYLIRGRTDHSDRTFWTDIRALPAGHTLEWKNGQVTTRCWYDFSDRVGLEYDPRSMDQVRESYKEALFESVRLRFRADVPVAINLSGGLDSSLLLALVKHVQGAGSEVDAYTFTTGDPRYDELPWVKQMLAETRHPSIVCQLSATDVPQLAEQMQSAQDEPFGGVPTLAYARLFATARARGRLVILDGQGMDEQWAGYDYYDSSATTSADVLIQGSSRAPVRPESVLPELHAAIEPQEFRAPFPDELRNKQYRDIRYTKLPRALRFNDRVSMSSSTELREPFLDHQLFEIAMRQRPEYKILNGTRKLLLRELATELAPQGVVEAPKRPLQTPQREWLRGELRPWAEAMIERSLSNWGGIWLDSASVRRSWHEYVLGDGDNSFHVWQWISLGMLSANATGAAHV